MTENLHYCKPKYVAWKFHCRYVVETMNTDGDFAHEQSFLATLRLHKRPHSRMVTFYKENSQSESVMFILI